MQYNHNNPLKVCELFAGYGSQAMALERLKRDFPPFDYKVVAISEIEPSALRAYEAVHGHCPNMGDITKIDFSAHEELKGCNLITYSFPCTDISNAGRQEGFTKGSGTRSSLLWECERAVRDIRPKYLLMENVRAIVQKKFMPHFNEWIELLKSYGYESFWKIINSKNQGIPQNRERVFLVSIRRDSPSEDIRYEFPFDFPLTKCVEDYMEPAKDVGEEYYIDQSRVTEKVLSDILDQPHVRAEMEKLYHEEEAFLRLFGRYPRDKEIEAHQREVDEMITQIRNEACGG